MSRKGLILAGGSSWVMTIQYAVQPSPDGAGAGRQPVHGHDLIEQLRGSNGQLRFAA